MALSEAKKFPNSRRQHRRVTTDQRAKIVLGGHSYACRITDISYGGAGLTISPMPNVLLGDALLEFAAVGAIPCVVRWSSMTKIGVEFTLSDSGRRRLRSQLKKLGLDGD